MTAETITIRAVANGWLLEEVYDPAAVGPRHVARSLDELAGIIRDWGRLAAESTGAYLAGETTPPEPTPWTARRERSLDAIRMDMHAPGEAEWPPISPIETLASLHRGLADLARFGLEPLDGSGRFPLDVVTDIRSALLWLASRALEAYEALELP